MKRLFILFIGILSVMCTLSSCDDNDQVYASLPQKISEFVSQYYPNSKVSDYTANNGVYTVVIDDGPTMVFDKDMQWTSVDGNGSVLPQVLLFDQLPPQLYEYLQQESDLNNVFSVSRTDKQYSVNLLSQSLTYDIDTGTISGK